MTIPPDLIRVAKSFEEIAKSKGVPSIEYRKARDLAIAELGVMASTEAYRAIFVRYCDEYLSKKAGR